MADDKSWNLWHGCQKYSAGCQHCYMYKLDEVHGVPEKSARFALTKEIKKPLARDKYGNFKIPPGFILRVNMTSDTFWEMADPYRDEMWDIIRRRPDLRFYLLTKRAQRIRSCLPWDWGAGYENVQLNITCENQLAFNKRWPILREIPARHKGMNLAPLLGPIDIRPALATGQIEHIDLGGESFGGIRPCAYEWVKDISDACRQYGVNFVFNSTGTIFVKDGRRYTIRSKEVQRTQAYKSKLSYYHGAVSYNLIDPYDGHSLQDYELRQVRYHAERCLLCTSMETCVGCTVCGGCQKAELVDLSGLLAIRQEKGV